MTPDIVIIAIAFAFAVFLFLMFLAMFRDIVGKRQR